MKIQTDNLSPFIQHNNLSLRPDIHNNYPVTVFKPNEEVTVELINNQAKVSTDQVTEYWNIMLTQKVNDQITDAVTTENKMVKVNTDKMLDDAVNLKDTITVSNTAKVLQINK